MIGKYGDKDAVGYKLASEIPRGNEVGGSNLPAVVRITVIIMPSLYFRIKSSGFETPINAPGRGNVAFL